MSYRARIAIDNGGENYESIYCRDGHPKEGIGDVLLNMFYDVGDVRSLIAVGSISHIYPDGSVRLYPNGEVRVDEWKGLCNMAIEAVKTSEEFLYIFKDDEWYMCELPYPEENVKPDNLKLELLRTVMNKLWSVGDE